MNFVVNTAEMTSAETQSEKNGISRIKLMQNAALGCFLYFKKRFSSLINLRFVIICGPGNNGGDGVELGFLLREHGVLPIMIFTGKIPDTDTAAACIERHKVSLEAIFVGEHFTNPQKNKNKFYPVKDGIDSAFKALKAADIIIDCVFGTGFHGELSQICEKIFDFVKDCEGFKASIDIPSGVNSDSGAISTHSFKPDVTLCLGAVKTGMLNFPCGDFCGERTVVDIGIKDDCYLSYSGKLTNGDILKSFPKRNRCSNKGSFGRLLNIAGSENYIGAAILSSKAALRSGVGLVVLASVKEAVSVAAAAVPECVFLKLSADKEGFIDGEAAIAALSDIIKKASAITIGCGMGNRRGTAEIVSYVLKNSENKKCPVILDADGINCLSKNINVLKDNDRPIILTPHPGEFSRLIGVSVEDIQSNRLKYAKDFASDTKTVVLLKGADTVIASHDGRVFINTTGNNSLSKAGCGDVLTGIIGSLAAQGVDPFHSAVLGAYIHGLAAERCCERMASASVLAGDVVDELGKPMS